MASSYTGLGTELMTTGENAGTWGTTTNTNLQIIEQISGGYVEQAVTTTTTLSVSDGSTGATLSHRVIKFTGTLSANATVTIPLDVQQMYVLLNGTAGAYTLTFKYVSGSGSTVAWAATDKGTKLVYATADHATNPNMVDSGIGSTAGHDLDGNELILDADADTSITADTDDQIDIKIAGADDFQFTANTFTAQAGSTIAAQALTATTVTASGIVKTDDTTEATSTTDGSLQTDGGLSVAKDAVFGDDVKLLSDSAVLSFGADSDTTLTHTDGTGLTLNSTNKLLFRDTGLYINSSTDGQLDLVADTEIQIAATTIDINGAIAMDGAITGATNITLSGELDAATLDISGNADIDGTANLDAVDIDGAVQIDNTITVGANDQGYDIIFYGDTASANMTWDTSVDDLILNGAARIVIPDGQLVLGSTAVTTTAAEINLIDGGASTGTTAVADADGILTNDNGTMRLTTAATFKTYFQTGVTASSIAADDIAAGDGAVTLSTTSGNITVDATANDSDIIFKGTDATSDITMLTLDGSEAGAATFNDKVIATELDISGNVDIDGTLETDAITLNGSAFIKVGGTNFTSSLLVGHATSGTLDAAQYNTGIGDAALDALTTGDNNTAVGYNSLTAINTGTQNVAVGGWTLATATNDAGNVAVGYLSQKDATGQYNTSVGYDALEDVTGSYNIAIGNTAGSNITSGSGNVIIGDVDAAAADSARTLKIAGNDGSTLTTWISGDGSGNLTFAADVTLGDDLLLDSDSSVLKFGDDGEVTLTHVHNDGLLLNTDMQLQFRDSAINIRSDADGDLDINADDELELNSTLIDLNGNLDVSGTLTQAGVATFSVAANVAQVALTSSSNAVAWDASAAANAYHITTENTTFAAPSNAVEGAFICLELNFNGSHTIGWNTVFEFAASTEPTETATDGKTDIHVFRYNGAVWQEVGRTLNLAES